MKKTKNRTAIPQQAAAGLPPGGSKTKAAPIQRELPFSWEEKAHNQLTQLKNLQEQSNQHLQNTTTIIAQLEEEIQDISATLLNAQQKTLF